jgi:hypothetical protein
MKGLLTSISILVLLLTIGCAKDDVVAPSEGEGEIRMHLIDAPANAEQVVVTVNRVEVHAAGSDETSGWFVVNDQPASYDLLTLRNGASAILGSAKLKAGRYTQIRLIVGAGSYIKIGGTTFNLEISSGMQTGIKLNHSFVIEEGKLYELYLDFDAGRSIVRTGNGQYRMSPVIRCQPKVVSGEIAGTVQPTEANARIWTVAGADTVSTVAGSNGSFKLMALPEGTYTVHIEATNTAYVGIDVPGVVVTRGQTTNIGTITLQRRSQQIPNE